MCLWSQELKLEGVGTQANPARRVLRLTQRTIDKHGNPLLLPAYELEGWTNDLTSNAGLALVGQYTRRLGVNALVKRKFPLAVGGIPQQRHFEVLPMLAGARQERLRCH